MTAAAATRKGTKQAKKSAHGVENRSGCDNMLMMMNTDLFLRLSGFIIGIHNFDFELILFAESLLFRLLHVL
jgi:hypothetical protein